MSPTNNADIFDEEELLAIANDSDGGNEGSGIASSSSSSANSDGKVLRVDSTSCAQEVVGGTHMQESDDDDDDDDDGFLESWFEAEDAKKRSLVSAREENASSELDESGRVKNGGDKTTTNNSDDKEEIMESMQDGERETQEHNEMKNGDRIKLLLGPSVLNWISGKKTRYSRSKLHKTDDSTCGLVGIERYCSGQDDTFSQRSSLILRLANNSSRKRTRVETSETVVANLETDTLSSSSPVEKPTNYIGQATFPNQRKDGGIATSSDEPMVDCIAIYDHNKKCYVLEVVDYVVTHLSLSSSENNEADTTISSRNERNAEVRKLTLKSPPNQNDKLEGSKGTMQLIDPRSSTKRADNQIKMLKRGRRKKETNTTTTGPPPANTNS